MKRLLLLICILFQVKSMKASHVAGGELTYQCLGNGTYEVTYIHYRDCFGGATGTSMTVYLNNSCGFSVSPVVLNQVGPPLIINPSCAQNSTCLGGTIVGIEKYIYTGIMTLPAGCSSWTLGISESARSGGLTGVPTASFYNLYVSAALNNMNNICDNSPVFEIDPVITVCTNQPYCINLGCYDSDGDSLVYSFVSPMSDANSSVPYAAPYTCSQPFNSNAPATLNTANGELCFTSAQPFSTCYAVLVQEYRNGLIIGQVERDIVLYSYNCSPSPPLISGVNGTTIYDMSVCAYYPACFYIYTNDPNTSDSTTITWDHSISSASINTSAAQHELGFFCWIPGQSDIDSVPHCFTVFANDNGCPAFQRSSKTFCITVHDTTAICSPVVVGSVDSDKNKLLIYPQPASDRLYVDYGEELPCQNKLTLTISNILNKVVYRTMLNERIASIDIHDNISSGIYHACIMDQRGAVIKYSKFVVNK